MPYVTDQDGTIVVDDEEFDKKLRFLALAALPDDGSEPGATLEMAGAERGLPGGKPVKDEKDFFSKFEVRVRSEGAQFRPPATLGDTGEGVPLSVDFRVERASDFSGAELRRRKPHEGEVNDLESLNAMLLMLFKELRRDLASGAPGSEAQVIRQRIAVVLRRMASIMKGDAA